MGYFNLEKMIFSVLNQSKKIIETDNESRNLHEVPLILAWMYCYHPTEFFSVLHTTYLCEFKWKDIDYGI